MGLMETHKTLQNMTGAQLSNRMKPGGVATPNVVQAETPKTPNVNGNGNQATRQALNNMGFNDADIDWDGNRVTYKGQGIVEPAEVTDGVSYAPENINYAGAVDWLENNGYQGIRQGLNARGIADEDIGWDNGNVTVYGQKMFDPQYNVNGTTYATEDELNAIAGRAYASRGDNLVAPRDYASSKGYGTIIDWDGENVIVGGQAVKPAYIKDGTAWIPKSEMDRLIGAYESNSGVVNNKTVVDNVNEEYKPYLDQALSKLMSRGEFSWNPDTDKSWQTHKEQQTELAEDAYRRILEDNNTSVTGASGAVLSEAMAAKDNYLARLAQDEIEFRQNAYDEYAGETDRLRNQFSDLYYAYNDEFGKEYQANRDNYNDSRQAGLDERDERRYWNDYEMKNREYERDVYVSDRDYDLRELQYKQDVNEFDKDYQLKVNADQRESERSDYENAALMYSNERTAFDNAIAYASTRGAFIEDDEKYIPGLYKYRDGNGGYTISPWSNEVKYLADTAYANSYYQQRGIKDANK